MHRNAERIRALIESPKTPWSTTDQPFLEGLADDRLAQFESGMKPAETPQSQPQQVAAAAATQVDMANLPPAVRDIVTEHNARLAAEKSQLVQGVLRSCRGAYTEADLVAMDQAGLRRLHKALDGTDVVDFGPLGSHRGAAVTETTAAPDGWALALQARKGA